MHLVEFFLPLADNNGVVFSAHLYEQVRDEMIARFGGVTSFSRGPARGSFRDGSTIVHDDVVVFQVMIEVLDREWWGTYRRSLERTFGQDEVLIRAVEVMKL
ncbi:hypothetical protein [Rhodoplanes roseus]|uniref:DUF1330 domain-containing protein n=1 Tax=Rhodoplanes roseus TaxID=29409 RepID=A0A327L082_9BRAD|nr:hypothetical protein [Rhodoplanes roseus]RAI43871.1 hypothetical protein CH341_12135 [Rhodoplanes roseus]